MSQDSRITPAILALVFAIVPRHHAAAQSILDRAKKTAQDAANAGKKAVSDEANRQLQSAVRDAAAENVADGNFTAVLTPWSSADGTKRVELARYTGSAFVVSSGSGEQVVLCDAKGVQAWEATFAVQSASAGATAGRGGSGTASSGGGRGGSAGSAGGPAAAGDSAGGKSGGGRSAGGATGAAGSGTGNGRGGGATSSGSAAPASGTQGAKNNGATGSAGGTGNAGATGGKSAGANGNGAANGNAGASGGRGGAAGGSSGRGSNAGTAAAAGDSTGAKGAAGAKSTDAAAPSATERKFDFPSTAVTIAFPTVGAQSGKATEGSFTLGDVSQSVVAGAGKLRFSQATIPGEKGPQVVDFGVAFKARAVTQKDIPTGCLSPNGSKTQTVAGTRGAAPAGRGAAGAAATAPPAGTTPAFAEGDYLIPKVDNLKLLAASSDTAKLVATIRLGTALVYLGEEENGYVHVQGSAGDGWIRKALLVKR